MAANIGKAMVGMKSFKLESLICEAFLCSIEEQHYKS